MPDGTRRRRHDGRRWGWESPTYQAVDLRFRVRVEDGAVGRFLEAALAPLASRGPHSCTYEILDDSPAHVGRWVVHRDGLPVGVPGAGHVALQWLLWDLNRAAVRASRSRLLLLHAGAVSRDGSAVVVPGPSGSGKSTLTAGLLAHGFSYLSDESPGLELDGTGVLQPYHKPLSLEVGSWALLPELEPPPAARPPAGWGWDQWLVDPRRIPGSGGLSGPAPVRLVVVPAYAAGARTRLEPLSRGEAVLTLAAHAFNFGDRPAQHVLALAGLVRGAACYRLLGGNLREAVAAVAEAHAERAPSGRSRAAS